MSVLSKFTTQLAESGKIQDDEPLVGIIEGLIGEFEVSTENRLFAVEGVVGGASVPW